MKHSISDETIRRMEAQRQREETIRKAEQDLIDACGPDLDRMNEAANRILRAWYHREILGMADDIRREIKTGTITTVEGIQRRIDEHTDCDLAIYTGKSMDVYNASDSRDEWMEIAPTIGELAPGRTDDIPWDTIAAITIGADLRDYLSEEIEAIETEPEQLDDDDQTDDQAAEGK